MTAERKYFAGVDSSTQGCKVVILDDTGRTVRAGKAPHPPGTEVDPNDWWLALNTAIDQAGGLEDVAAISIAGQQHGMVALDEHGRVIRRAMLWNDTKNAPYAAEITKRIGGGDAMSERLGVVPVMSFTVSKIMWLADNEPQNAKKVQAVCLPHDWLTWRILGYGPQGESIRGPDLDKLVTDRSDASGTGYWNTRTGKYDNELFTMAFGRGCHEAGTGAKTGDAVVLPRVLDCNREAGITPDGIAVGPGLGDNAGGALGLNTSPGDVVVSMGTSGAVFSPSDHPVNDGSGTVAGFADGTQRMLPLYCTLNGARILEEISKLLQVDYDEISDLALRALPGAEGLVLIPYFEGERTPNFPLATARLYNMTLQNMTRSNLARAHVEALICTMYDGFLAIAGQGVEAKKLYLIGGASTNRAVQVCAAQCFGLPISVPRPGEYVARGAAIQAAWVKQGTKPGWMPELLEQLPSSSVTKTVYEQWKATQRDYAKEYLELHRVE